MTKLLPLVFLLIAVPPAVAQTALETDEQKTIYAIGTMVGQNVAPQLQSLGLAEGELAILFEGLKDAIAGQEPKVDLNAFGPKVQEFAAARSAKMAEVQKKEGAAYQAKMAAEAGAQKLPSGIIYFDTVPGTGASPGGADNVTVHYHGTLIDGTVFDSSVERGEPATFGLNQVIPCWTESVQKMKVGGKARIVCPPETAYGDRATGPIKPGSTLTFDVELLEIAAAAAAAAPAVPAVPAANQ